MLRPSSIHNSLYYAADKAFSNFSTSPWKFQRNTRMNFANYRENFLPDTAFASHRRWHRNPQSLSPVAYQSSSAMSPRSCVRHRQTARLYSPSELPGPYRWRKGPPGRALWRGEKEGVEVLSELLLLLQQRSEITRYDFNKIQISVIMDVHQFYGAMISLWVFSMSNRVSPSALKIVKES